MFYDIIKHKIAGITVLLAVRITFTCREDSIFELKAFVVNQRSY